LNVDEQRILGSAEPLTPEQRAIRLRELAAWGVDLSLSSVQMGKSPDECLDEWLAMRAFAEAAAQARATGRVYPYQPQRPLVPISDTPSDDTPW